MLASELDFHLPEALIAQTAIEPRDAARLLVLRRGHSGLEHRTVADLPSLLRPDDLLIFNDTRVLEARIHGQRESGGKVEALLLKEVARNEWECLLKPSARIRVGSLLRFSGGGQEVTARPIHRGEDYWIIRFELPEGENIRDHLSALGELPFPPYIKQKSAPERYQTVYSRSRAGEDNPLDSAAAPTAGLHFTPELLEKLRSLGIKTAFLTLAVGTGTFRPVQTETVEEHRMHTEEFWVPEATAVAIAEQRRRGGRVVAVGTTVTRTLESVAREDGTVPAGPGDTQIFIHPGFKFRCVDALITNFHLPKSTLLVLIAAFVEYGLQLKPPSSQDSGRTNTVQGSGLRQTLSAYAEAIDHGYRFFSFGDAMLIE